MRDTQGRRTARATLGLSAAASMLVACSGEPTENAHTSSVKGVEQVVYVVRQHTVIDDRGVPTISVAGGMGQVMDHGRYVPGGQLVVRELATGNARNIIDAKRFAKADIEGLDLHFDATRVVFSMKLDSGDNYHIYTANLEAGEDKDNPYNITQLTFGPYDDFHPVWVAGGRVAFVTTQPYTEMGMRADEYNHARQVPQIGVVTESGGDADRKLCSQNLSNTFNLFGMASGQIGFSRWEHLENVNDSKLFAMNPDCTQMVAVSGQHGKDGFNSLVQVTETNDPNVFVAIGTSRENTLQAGSIVQVDARAEGDDSVHDEERSSYQVLTPAVPKGEEASAIGRYRTPSMLPDDRLLVSWARGDVNENNELALTPPDWGLYIYDPETRTNELIFNDENTWELYGRAVVPRDKPPILASIQDSQDATLPLELGAIDIRNTSLSELHGNTVTGAQFDGTPVDQALRQAVKVRIIEGFSSEAAGVNMFGLTMAEGAAIVGEATVRADGSWMAEVPPFVPYHLQAVDEYELAIRNQTTWIQGMPGESRVCGGCHEERTGANTPTSQQLASAAASSLIENFMLPVDQRTEYPWAGAADNANEVQKILDAKCAQCHNETTNGDIAQETYSLTMTDEETETATTYDIPRLDLSSRQITVTYDNGVETYPASYVSIFYPAAVQMEIGMGAEIEGNLPPEWGVPSDARNSALIEKLNITSAIDSSRTAWPLDEAFTNADVRGGTRTMHPEDVGVELTREERTVLIRAIDMGGQYYARQNTGFEPFEAGASGGGVIYE